MTEYLLDSQESNKTYDKTIKKPFSYGKYFVYLTGGAAIGLSILSIPFVTPALRKICLPYVPATDAQIANVIKALKGREGSLIDLGSGDGRIVISAAKRLGLASTGVELNPWLVWYSRFSGWSSGVSRRTRFVKKNLWKHSLLPYDNIVIFGVEEMMPMLEEKLNEELISSGCVVACRFPLPTWTPTATIGEGINTVWLYKRP